MILKKPYLFFIKIFKPVHLCLAVLTLILLYFNNKILTFLNEFVYSSGSLISEETVKTLLNGWLNVIPIILIVCFLIFMGVMFKKNKPVLFYFVGICSLIVVLIINVYTANTFNILTENLVSFKVIKLIHDLVVIKMIIESVLFLFLLIRGLGLDFKRFDFNSDLSSFEISESDNEEFEVNINVDFNERKRRRKEKFRKFKYIYIENKYIINIFACVFVIGTAILTFYLINKANQINKEGIYYSTETFTFKVNNTISLNTDYQGNKITDNYLIIVDANLKSNRINNSLYLNDFSLKINDLVFKPTNKYSNSLIDLGTFYDEQVLSLNYTDYLFVYEIPNELINEEIIFSYNDKGNITDIVLSPKKMNIEEMKTSINLGEILKFENVLSGVEFKINQYEIKDKFLIEYKYCIKEEDCILSKEYLKPSINKNYDKIVLKINVDYTSTSDLDLNEFYDLLSSFGSIVYKKGDKVYTINSFEEIKSKKVSNKNNIYVGINQNILDAESIKIVFNIRDYKYEYILK